MTGVEGPHGGHEGNSAMVEELSAAPLAEGGDVAKNFDRCIRYYWVFGS